MRLAAVCLLLLLATHQLGCEPVPKRSSGDSQQDEKKDPKKNPPTGGVSGDRGQAKEADNKPKANPLVGRWVIKKTGTQDWSSKFTKDAVIEFHNDGQTMTVADTKATGKGVYTYTGDGFIFTIDVDRKDGSRDGGFGGTADVTKMTDQEIVADLFTLRRVK
jgi:hypothetical protein